MTSFFTTFIYAECYEVSSVFVTVLLENLVHLAYLKNLSKSFFTYLCTIMWVSSDSWLAQYTYLYSYKDLKFIQQAFNFLGWEYAFHTIFELFKPFYYSSIFLFTLITSKLHFFTILFDHIYPDIVLLCLSIHFFPSSDFFHTINFFM